MGFESVAPSGIQGQNLWSWGQWKQSSLKLKAFWLINVHLMRLFGIFDFLNPRGSKFTLVGQLQKMGILNFYKGVKDPCRISFLIFGHQAKQTATPL